MGDILNISILHTSRKVQTGGHLFKIISENLENVSQNEAEVTYRPRGEVFEMLRLTLTVIFMTTCINRLLPCVGAGVIFRCNIMGNTIDNHVGNNFGEV